MVLLTKRKKLEKYSRFVNGVLRNLARKDKENPRDEMAAIREAKNCSPLEAMKEIINPDSLKVLTNCYVEKFLADSKPLDYLQFQRIGYFNVDKDSTVDKLVFNRTVSLKDTWSKVKDK